MKVQTLFRYSAGDYESQEAWQLLGIYTSDEKAVEAFDLAISRIKRAKELADLKSKRYKEERSKSKYNILIQKEIENEFEPEWSRDELWAWQYFREDEIILKEVETDSLDLFSISDILQQFN